MPMHIRQRPGHFPNIATTISYVHNAAHSLYKLLGDAFMKLGSSGSSGHGTRWSHGVVGGYIRVEPILKGGGPQLQTAVYLLCRILI